jgi:uncharacterized membrane-anchored protein YhcB (DUF1043 family)
MKERTLRRMREDKKNNTAVIIALVFCVAIGVVLWITLPGYLDYQKKHRCALKAWEHYLEEHQAQCLADFHTPQCDIAQEKENALQDELKAGNLMCNGMLPSNAFLNSSSSN